MFEKDWYERKKASLTLAPHFEFKAIKNYKGHEGEPLSQGNIYYKKKKVGFISDGDWGGPTDVRFDHELNKTIKNEIDDLLKSIVDKVDQERFNNNDILEHLFNKVVEDKEKAKHAKKVCAKEMLVRFADHEYEDGQWHVFKYKNKEKDKITIPLALFNKGKTKNIVEDIFNAEHDKDIRTLFDAYLSEQFKDVKETKFVLLFSKPTSRTTIWALTDSKTDRVLKRTFTTSPYEALDELREWAKHHGLKYKTPTLDYSVNDGKSQMPMSDDLVISCQLDKHIVHCECEQSPDSNFFDDGQCTHPVDKCGVHKHHYHCTVCNGVTQIG